VEAQPQKLTGYILAVVMTAWKLAFLADVVVLRYSPSNSGLHILPDSIPLTSLHY